LSPRSAKIAGLEGASNLIVQGAVLVGLFGRILEGEGIHPCVAFLPCRASVSKTEAVALPTAAQYLRRPHPRPPSRPRPLPIGRCGANRRRSNHHLQLGKSTHPSLRSATFRPFLAFWAMARFLRARHFPSGSRQRKKGAGVVTAEAGTVARCKPRNFAKLGSRTAQIGIPQHYIPGR